MASFSFLLPTRGKPRLARRFLQSVVETADRAPQIEVILGVDEDDIESHGIAQEGLAVKTIILPRGLTMGALNRACFEASSGRYVMLINDDVIVRTRGWDSIIYRTFARYGDDLALVHVNDLLFRQRLCTFPILSRKACLEIGICPAGYRRYRIDDHIYDTYSLLSYLGYNRLVYLDHVVFEHDNYSHAGAPPEHDVDYFQSVDGKVYVPNPDVFEHDTRDFMESLEERKRDARKLAQLIETAAVENRQASHETLLARVHDPYSYRQYCGSPSAASFAAGKRRSRNVTIAVVTSDLCRPHAQKCLSLLKKHTSDFELMILDNNRGKQFNHPREMNKVLQTAKTDFVVLLDDDVFVTPGWLEGLLDSVNAQTGIVTPLHRDRRGAFSYSGVYLIDDAKGTHAHTLDVPPAPRVCQCICSAAVLIDRTKCHHLFFNEAYQKYFLDLDYALQVWEAGYEVVCTPKAVVTHLGGGTMPYTSPESAAGNQRDSATFVATWTKTGRLDQIRREMWSRHDYLRQLTEIPQRIEQALDRADTEHLAALRLTLERLIADLRPFPRFYDTLTGRLSEYANLCRMRGQAERALCVESVFGRCSSDPFYARLPRALKRRFAHLLTFHLLPQIASLAKRSPWARRAVQIARANAASAWDRYQRLPAPVHFVFDRPLFLVKRVAAPVLRPPAQPQLGLYKGFRLVKAGEMIHALPTSRVQEALEHIDGGGKGNLCTTELPRLKNLVDDLVKKLDGNMPAATHLLHRPAEQRALPEPIEKYKGVQLIPFEGRYFGLANGDVFDAEKIRTGRYRTCFVGHSLGEMRLRVDQAHRHTSKAVAQNGREKVLVACNAPVEMFPQYLKSLADYDTTLLVPEGYHGPHWNRAMLSCRRSADGQLSFWEPSQGAPTSAGTRRFDAVAIPYVPGDYWKGTEYEYLATVVAKRLMLVLPDGTLRNYCGEDMRRILYNKSCLSSMLRYVTSIRDKRILEVGCSDGLACNLLLGENPAAITGVDVMETVGCVYRDPKITYAKMNAANLHFADQTFDVCYSIATLEHCQDPYAALQEMKRVTKRGGFVYVQAGPLYYGPFGHHMFGYFDAFPWVHLRLPVEGILDYCRTHQIDQQIRQRLGRNPEHYVREMMSTDHLNGLSYQEYCVTEFIASPDLEIFGFSRAREGENLLTESILRELPDIPREDLVSHGFELALRRR